MCAARFGTVERYSEFGSQHDPVAERLQSPAQQLLVVVRSVGRAVNLGRIEKGVTHLHGIGQQHRHFFLVGRRAIGMAHAHTAKPDGGDTQTA